jgi:hypothetical protein
LRKWERFLIYWNLAQLPGPFLPLPYGEMHGVPSEIAKLQPGHRRTSDEVTVTSPTAPALPPDIKNSVAGDAGARDGAGAHLDEWFEIIRRGNVAKHQTLVKYARIFRLQHYWRVLHERYGREALAPVEGLIQPFARFLGVGADAIRADLKLLRTALGPDWFGSR